LPIESENASRSGLLIANRKCFASLGTNRQFSAGHGNRIRKLCLQFCAALE